MLIVARPEMVLQDSELEQVKTVILKTARIASKGNHLIYNISVDEAK